MLKVWKRNARRKAKRARVQVTTRRKKSTG
jgi:hypothetical protein